MSDREKLGSERASGAEYVDVLIVGAGLSGVGAAYHLQTKCPKKTYAIVESRDSMGGTWDLFRYPGIRSDSDMYTLGYKFRPWKGEKAIADGPEILRYIKETARDYGIDEKIRYGHKVLNASWSSQKTRWTVTIQRSSPAHPEGETITISCHFLFMCTGYYDYASGYSPEFPGAERFGKERIVHPQLWTDDIDYANKRVVVIGSGATAVTLVPELAKKAAHVTMLQRSPSYILSLPGVDAIAHYLAGKLPIQTAYGITRAKNVGLSMAFYNYCRQYPERAKNMLIGQVRKKLGKDYDVKTHFTPKYSPWDERLCLTPNDDFFDAIKSGRAEVVTDHITSFTEKGIQLESGKTLEADLIVTATGLKILFGGGVEIVVDGARVDFSKTMSYRGAMYSDVPNFAAVLGYTNASWTLKADLICEFVCRVLNTMDRTGKQRVVPRVRDVAAGDTPVFPLASGYVQRAIEKLPKQGKKSPWRIYQNYVRDIFGLRFGSLDDEYLELAS